MLATDQGILRNNRIEGGGGGGGGPPHDQPVRVHVTLYSSRSCCAAARAIRAKRMAAALEKLAASQEVESIADPASWGAGNALA